MRVILVDEQRAFRDSLRIALWHEAAIAVCGQTESARELYPLVESENPDLVACELMLNDTDAISAVREMRRRHQEVRVVLLTMYNNPLFAREALDAGISGYILKDQPLADIIAAFIAVVEGRPAVSPAVAQELAHLAADGGAGEAAGAGIGRLSHREREVFCRIIQGDSSQAIANALSISIKTVETHRTHINRKLGVRSPVELIRLAALQGLLKGDNSPPFGNS